MIRGKFLAQDDFDLAGHRFLNWQWISDLPTREGEEGYTIAIVQGKAKWVQATADGLVIVEWEDILNKPTEFAPEAHTHPWDEVTGKPTEFTPEAHTHPWDEVTSKPTEFTPEAHTHLLTDLQQSGAATNEGILWNGTTWLANPVFRIAVSAIQTDFALGTPTYSHVIVIESTGGAQRYCSLALLPVSTATQTALDLKQDTLVAYDAVPTDASTNIVESNGVYDALATKQATLVWDTVPVNGSTKPVRSNGIFDELATKQDTLAAYDTVPTDASTNICESNGIFDELATKMDLNSVTTVTGGAYTLAGKTIVIGTAASAITLTLPAASSKTGVEYVIKRSGAGGNGITINAGAGDTIDGANTIYLFTQYDMWRIISDGSNWHKIGII